MLAGCYTLDLYCDNPDHEWAFREFPDQYFDELGSVCRRKARKRGWKISLDRVNGGFIAICPKCNGRGGKP